LHPLSLMVLGVMLRSRWEEARDLPPLRSRCRRWQDRLIVVFALLMLDQPGLRDRAIRCWPWQPFLGAARSRAASRAWGLRGRLGGCRSCLGSARDRANSVRSSRSARREEFIGPRAEHRGRDEAPGTCFFVAGLSARPSSRYNVAARRPSLPSGQELPPRARRRTHPGSTGSRNGPLEVQRDARRHRSADDLAQEAQAAASFARALGGTSTRARGEEVLTCDPRIVAFRASFCHREPRSWPA